MYTNCHTNRGDVHVGDALTHAVAIKDYKLTEKLLKYLKSKNLLDTVEMSVPFVDDETLKMTRKIKRKIKINLEQNVKPMSCNQKRSAGFDNSGASTGGGVGFFSPGKSDDRVLKHSASQSDVYSLQVSR